MRRRGQRFLNLAAYAGKWVVLSRDRVVGVGDSLPEVMRNIPAHTSRADSSAFLVPRRDEGPYVLVVIPPLC